MSWNQYPGQQQHQQQQYHGAPQGPPPNQYTRPAGPPPGAYQGQYQPPPVPPQGYQKPQGHYTPQYGPPSGPPPVNPNARPSYAPPQGPPPQAIPTQAQNYGPTFQAQNGQQQPYFQYSQCNGNKKALLVGINYIGSSNALSGCINDVHNVKNFICVRYGYKEDDIVVLTDDARDPRSQPTRANILAAMQWLVRGAQPNDALFFHYSGHGGQTPDLDGDEDDGFDEVIYPVDFKETTHIVDDQMHDIMVRSLPPGCRLTAIFDSCHSGTALDLPYVYSTEGKIKEPNLLAEAGQGILGAGMSYLRGDLGGMMSGLMGTFKQVSGGNQASQQTKQTKTSPADVISWSGCKDSQTSADTQEAGKATGAMSYAFIAALTKYPQQSYQQLLVTIREELRGKVSVTPFVIE